MHCENVSVSSVSSLCPCSCVSLDTAILGVMEAAVLRDRALSTDWAFRIFVRSSLRGRWYEHESGSSAARWEAGGVSLSIGMSVTRVVYGGGVFDFAFLFSVAVEGRLVDTGGSDSRLSSFSLRFFVSWFSPLGLL